MPLVVTGGGDGAVRVWDAMAEEILSCVDGHYGGVGCCTVLGGGRLLTGGDEGGVVEWKLGIGGGLEKLRMMEDLLGEPLCCVQVLRSMKSVVCCAQKIFFSVIKVVFGIVARFKLCTT